MPFTRPTLQELITRTQGDLNSTFAAAGYGADSRIRRSLLWVTARVFAGGWHAMYGVLDWLSRQILPSTSDDEQLVAQAALYGLTKRPPQASDGSVRLTGTSGTVIPIGTELARSDGVIVETTAAGTLASSEATIAAVAQEPGDEGNMELATALTLVSPIAGVDSTATAVAGGGGWSTGSDIETTTELRARLAARIRETPQGGAEGDYVAWALQVSGVTRARCLPEARGAGTVDVVFLHAEGTAPLGIPTSGQIAAVQTYLNAVAPVVADVLVRAPAVVDVDYTFDSLDADTVDVHNAIEAELTAMFAARALVSTTLSPSDSYTAISSADGVVGFDVSVPSAPVTCDADEVLGLGTITWPV